MPAMNKLSAVEVKAKGKGKYSDGGGLWLHKRADGVVDPKGAEVPQWAVSKITPYLVGAAAQSESE